MQNKILMLVILLLGNCIGETYITMNGPVTSTKVSYCKLGRCPNYIHWENSEITWQVNDNGCCINDNISLELLVSAVRNGFNSWDETPAAALNFYDGGTTETRYGNDRRNIVYWAEAGDLAFEYGGPLEGRDGGTLAITILTINDRGEILDADIVFNGRDHIWRIDDSDPDIWAVTTHEVGHVLGLFHSDVNPPVNADLPSMVFSYNSIDMRDITRDDEAGVSFLYGGSLIEDEIFEGNIYLKWDLNVLAGSALTIRPGTKIKCFKWASIRISGELLAEGNFSEAISFMPYGNGSWKGIYFRPFSKGLMAFCSIKGVKLDGAGAVTINGSSPQIRNCVIANNSGYCHGICAVNQSAPLITNDSLYDNSARPIYVVNSDPFIEGNSLSAPALEDAPVLYADFTHQEGNPKNISLSCFYNYFHNADWGSACNTLNILLSGYAGDEDVMVAQWLLSQEYKEMSSGVKPPEKKKISEFRLDQNYPNPFNPITSIRILVRARALVSVTVYNSLGEEIEKICNDEKEPGVYTIEWNASGLSSGIYYYRLKAGDFIQTKKMILMK